MAGEAIVGRGLVEGNPVQNKTLITVTAVIALVALGVAVLTLFIF